MIRIRIEKDKNGKLNLNDTEMYAAIGKQICENFPSYIEIHEQKDYKEFKIRLSELEENNEILLNDIFNLKKQIVEEINIAHEDYKELQEEYYKLQDENKEFKNRFDMIKNWVKGNLYEDGCIDCTFTETDKLLAILKDE